MNAKLTLSICIITVALLPVATASSETVSFEQARELSVRQGKPILLEFVHDD